MRRILYDRSGTPTLYLTGAGVVYDLENRALGTLQGETVVSYSGRYCGSFDGSFLRDSDGKVAAFIKGAKEAEGLELPPTQALRVKPQPTPATLYPLAVSAPKPAPQWQWSEHEPTSLFTQGDA